MIDAVRELVDVAKQCVHAVDTIDLRTRLREALAALESAEVPTKPEVALERAVVESAMVKWQIRHRGRLYLACAALDRARKGGE